MAGVLHNLPSGEVSTDGLTFTDRDTGFSIRAPEGKAGWKLEVEPGAKFSAQITNQDGSSQVGAGVYDIGSPAPLEEVAAQIRKAFTAKLGKNGRDLGSELVTRGGTRYMLGAVSPGSICEASSSSSSPLSPPPPGGRSRRRGFSPSSTALP
jgi:hypothetical protein